MAGSVPNSAARGTSKFQQVVDAFLSAPGLPFANILSAQRIERIFAKHGCLFGLHSIYSTAIMVWSFLSQVLRDGKEASCQAAVARVVSYCEQAGLPAPTEDTGDYCRARAKLSEAALHDLAGDVAQQMEQAAEESWLWKGRHAKLVDGFTFTMPDTPENQALYPQPKSQKPGVGLPIARAVAIVSLATACVMDLAIGPYKGKETGEVDPDQYTKEEIAQLFGFRWDSELDIRSIKSSLNLGHVRCKSPEMVRREVWTTILGYNLIRTTAAGAALLAGKQPRQISFTGTCQYVLASWMQLSCGLIERSLLGEYLREMLRQIAGCEVADRPGRLEPRVLKRRRHGYKLMRKPRHELRHELRKHCT